MPTHFKSLYIPDDEVEGINNASVIGSLAQLAVFSKSS
jgi:hypothetical protein